MNLTETQQALFDAMEPDVWYSDFEDGDVKSFGELGEDHRRPYYTAGLIAEKGLLEKVKVERYAGYKFRRRSNPV